MKGNFKFFCLVLAGLMLTSMAWSEENQIQNEDDLQVIIDDTSKNASPEQTQSELALAGNIPSNNEMDPLRYTLGPEEVNEIMVLRHPEFSGTYPINLEGKIQYKFVGDIEVTGLTKKDLEQKISQIISKFIVEPSVNVTILEYKSKVIYILGEVASPGKYYMRSETIPVREAVVQAGLPTLAAAMRRCRLITPSTEGKTETKTVDLYTILYGGNLKNNIEMKPGDVLYVPATIMAKIMRVISPVAAPVATAASSVNSGNVLIR